MRFNLPETELKILKFWKEKDIFKKTLDRTKKGKHFVFFEGPPFANGLPGIHHLLARAFKDIILRYKTMQGFFVGRRAGWDTHGLPTEMAAEKSLGIKSKKEIEELGIGKFIAECEKNVFTYKKEWESFTERIGFWVDLKNAYITCDDEYIESLWWILKKIWEKGLLYEDYKVVPYCPRCETSLSSHEVAQGYKNIEEPSIYVRFRLKNEKNVFFLAWTTTPWTLPANVALAVNKDIDYVKVDTGEESLILAKNRLDVLGGSYKIVDEFKGGDLEGKEYEPLFDFIEPDKKAYYVISADFVSLEEGTGIVHVAPAFGVDDMEAAKKNNLPVLLTVDSSGNFRQEVSKWAGVFVKDADRMIVEDIAHRKLLFKEQLHKHDYPFCWRCKTPLLYYAKNSWFIKMTAIKKQLINSSKDINWEPGYIKEGRFGEWLKEVKDWNLSRERYWGTPLPIWRCECGAIKLIGSIDELQKLSGKKAKGLHRPHVDEIVLKCDECGKQMRRVSEVIDCWFDSGSMPFAQWHYPFDNKEKIDKGEYFPADFISEAVDQTRGWFYTLLAVSVLLGKGACYKNVICLGLVLDENAQKMSKSKGNIVKPDEVIAKFGADCSRLYFYTVNQAGEPKKFDFKDVEILYRKFFDTLWQSYVFFETYAPEKEFEVSNFKVGKSNSVLDKWIVSRAEKLNLQIIENLDKYDVVSAARLFLDFTDDLSNWYIRRSRDRFKDSDKDASKTLYYVLLKVAVLSAPFTPFFAEELYGKLNGKKESVHLEDYPEADKKLINNKLEEQMVKTRSAAAQALAKRAEAGIKVRQPLAKLTINNKLDKELLELLEEEVNVKEISFGKELSLDIKITEELKKEGEYRELVRNINNIRKEMRLTPKDFVIVDSTYSIENKKDLMKEIKAKEYNVKDAVENGAEIKIGDKKYTVLLIKA